jgi:hypothetical protein
MKKPLSAQDLATSLARVLREQRHAVSLRIVLKG